MLDTGNLGALALADGANPIYTFDEASGVLINRFSPGTFDVTVDAQVTRGVAAPGGPDGKGYGFIQTPQAVFPYGHAQGQRPDQNGWTRVAHECVCRVNTASQNGRVMVDGLWLGVIGLFGLGNDVNDDVNAYIALSGGFTAVFANSRSYKSGWHHYVWQYNGTNYQGYVDGVLDFNVVTGIGGPSFSDASISGDRRIAFGGINQSSSFNCHCDIAYYGMYQNIALTQQQITSHKKASGV